MKKPTTLQEIRDAAASMFKDPAVTSVNVMTGFGFECTVYRDGKVVGL